MKTEPVAEWHRVVTGVQHSSLPEVKLPRLEPMTPKGNPAGSTGRRMAALDFHGDMGQVGELGQPLPVMRRLARA